MIRRKGLDAGQAFCHFRSGCDIGVKGRHGRLKNFSIHADSATAKKHQPLDASKLTIKKSSKLKDLLPPEKLVFGRHFTGQPCNLFCPTAPQWYMTDQISQTICCQ